MLGGGHGVARGGVDHGHAASGGRFQVDVVHAHSRPSDDLEVYPGFQHLRGNLGVAADDEGFAIGDAVEELSRRQSQGHLNRQVRLTAEEVHPGLMNGIGDQDLRHGLHACLSDGGPGREAQLR